MFKRLTDAEIDKALVKAETFSGFLKPGLFEDWAQEVEGMPVVDSAYLECCEYVNTSNRKPLSHPGLYWAIQQTGSYELKTQTREKVFPRFKGFFEEMKAQIKSGREFEVQDLPKLEQKAPELPSNDSPGRQRFLKAKKELHQELISKGLIREDSNARS